MTEADPTVFVVDDDPSVRRSTERLVRSMGFNVQTFATAKEFRERARVESPSCLVLTTSFGRPDVRPRDEGGRGGVPDQADPFA